MEPAEDQPDDCHRPRGADRTGRAAMEPTGDRPDDLVKDVACGHHYRASLASLLAAGATMEDLTLTDDQSQADRATAAA